MTGLLAAGITAGLVLASASAWLWRVRQSRRFKRAMNAFADRENLREPRKAPRRVRV